MHTIEFRNKILNELTTTTVQIGQGEGGGVPPPLSLYFPANASNGPTLPPPTTVWSIGFTIHYPLTSLWAVFLKETTNSNRFEFQNNSLKSWFLFSWGSNCFLSSVGKNLCKGRDVELNRRAPRLKRASFSTLTTVSPCSHCTMLVFVNCQVLCEFFKLRGSLLRLLRIVEIRQV